MPLPLAAGAAIGAGSSLLGGVMNSQATHEQNRASQRFSREMYDRQRQDNIDFWNMQNQYNSPAAQMARFKEAGLNPHLIYGQGSNGNAGAVQSPTVQRPEFNSTRPGDGIASGGLAFISSMYDLEMKQAQIDNLQAQNALIKEDTAYRRIQSILGTTRNQRETFDLGQQSVIAPYNIEYLQERNRQTRVTTDIALNDDARRAAQSASSLKEAAERMLSMQSQRGVNRAQIDQIRATINNLEKEGVLKNLEIELRQLGINPNDPTYSVMLGRILANLFDFMAPGESLSPGGRGDGIGTKLLRQFFGN